MEKPEMQQRSADLPAGPWIIYQEWHEILFLHWKVPFEILRPLIPKELELDKFDGDCYVSLVPFSIKKTRPRYLPSFKFISDFDEINVRTYIDNGGKKGVYFLSIEAGKSLSAFISKAVSGLPYEKSKIHRTSSTYRNENSKRNYHLDIEFDLKEPIAKETNLDKWLTARYCVFLVKNDKIYSYDVHHKEWPLKNVKLRRLDLNYKIGNLHLNTNPELAHYSDGVKVMIWPRVEI